MKAKTDEFWMEEALREAERALAAGEVPIGAVVVHDGRIVGRGSNRPITENDPTAHAEVIALREAGRALGNYRLSGCEIYVSTEPCTMCAGAVVHARVKRLVYGSDDPKSGAIVSTAQLLGNPGLNHRVEIQGGVLAGRSAELLQSFFRSRRGVPRNPSPKDEEDDLL